MKSRAKSRLVVAPAAVMAIARELRSSAGSDKPLAVTGVGELAAALRCELARGGVASAVRDESAVDTAAALVHVVAGRVSDEDVALLKRASRAGIPIVCVLAGPRNEDDPDPPYVLAEHVVRMPPGSGFPLEAIARAIAKALGERATPLAARLPVLRGAVVDRMISQFARQNGVIGAAVFVPGADLPVLTLNQIRLLMRIADAYGFELDRERIPEVLATIGSGLGFRAVARSLLGVRSRCRLGNQGGHRLRRDAGARRGGAPLLREQGAGHTGAGRPRRLPSLRTSPGGVLQRRQASFRKRF